VESGRLKSKALERMHYKWILFLFFY